VWYHLSGADKDHVSAHEVTIAVPGATQASLGIPEQRRENGVWIMNAGTSTAHIMIPGRCSVNARIGRQPRRPVLPPRSRLRRRRRLDRALLLRNPRARFPRPPP